nr:WASH complex subunit 2 [Drosophila bipectinata]
MDISADVDQIIAKAPNWNIEGDCALLALMKRISQNLHERVDKTSSRFEEFEVSVKRADIALSNANNSLRSLQFGQQFVEYRVEEIKDEDLAMPQDKKEPETPPMSSEEMAKQFLENNLRMFRKNYEAVTIEVPDSDDEDAPVTTTTVFRAKNPYDAIPLPYIIGSKEWNEHKYAGLYDSKENSEDEKSEEFSSSSSDEREPVPSTSKKAANKPVEPHMSDSSSLASLPKEPKIISPTKAPNPLPTFPTPTPPAGPVKEPAPKSSQPRPIISSQRNPHEHDMFAALRQSPPSDDPPSTSSSPASSPAFGNVPGRLPKVSTASISSSSNSPAHQPPPTLFDEAIAPQTSREAQLPEASKPAEVKPSQVKRKPVNIFSDDEFNSFMSEITQKVQAKAGSSLNTTPASDTVSPTQSLRKTTQPVEQKVPKESQTKINPTVPTPSVPKRVNLFDDSPPLSPTPATSSTSSEIPPKGPQQNPPKPLSFDAPSSSTRRTSDLPPKNPPKALPKSLFDDDLEDDDFLSSFNPKPKPTEQKQKPKSLFDDDDLDVDDIFGKSSSKPTNLSTKVAGKTSLFDDDDQDDVTDIFGSKKLTTKRLEESPPKSLLEKSVEPLVPHRKSLFDDIEEEDLFGTPKAKNLFASREQISPISPEKTQGEVEKSRDIKEIKTEEIQNKEFKQVVPDDTFRPIHDQKSQATVAVEHQQEAKNEPQIVSTKPTDLFKDDFSDDDSFLTVSQPKVKPQGSKETKETIKPAERKFVPPKQDIPIPQSEPDKLFDEEVVQDEPKTKSIPKVPATTKETIDPTEDFVKEIDPEKIPTDKIDDEPVKKQKDSLAGKFSPISETPPPDDHQNQQDPIISMVADITNKSPKTEPTPRRAADLAAAQQIMQNYTNLFSEEPPDDSEFFQTLGSSGLSSLSASKIFDHEQDFFEPALPKVPSATKSSVVSPSEVQPSPSDYGGMRLFSDVPPEDFGSDPVPEKQVEPQKVETSSTTTRIHTIFYDDFSETARAGTVPTTPKHSVSTEKPPPADEPDRSKVKEASELPAPASPVKKLKMPNININVQALLPGSGARPKVLKKPETPHLDEDSQVPAHPDSLVTSPKEAVTPPSTEGGLQHVNKTRVRGPPRRRPSTRKGRQENYEKSLLDDERINKEVEGSNLESQDDSESISIQTPSSKTAPQENVLSSPVALFDEPPEDKPTPEKASAGSSFLDSDDESPFPVLAPPPKLQTVTAPEKNILAATNPLRTNEPPLMQSKTAPTKQIKLFDDSDDDDDDDLFATASLPAPVPTAQTTSKPTTQSKQSAKQKASFFSSDEDDELIPAKAPPKKKLPAKTTKSLFSDDDDDDDLFGGRYTSKASTSKQTRPASRSTAKPAPSKTSRASSKTPSDNPLADLLFE